jgi:SAM-dependent methyltransferase
MAQFVKGLNKGGAMGAAENALTANVDRFKGFAGQYNAVRPRPPLVLLDILTQLVGAPGLRLVVDLGSGTGLSTAVWAGRAGDVVGVEPSDDMRREAEREAPAGVRYVEGYSHTTGLADASADIVTASQALHWMEPTSTFAEVGRILRPGGVFAAYDVDWPPTVSWQAESAFEVYWESIKARENAQRSSAGVHSWSKEEHLGRMAASGQFRYTKEIVVHHVEHGDADRFVGIVLSQGGVAGLLKSGLSPEELGLPAFAAAVREAMGDAPVPFYWSYRVRLGVK